MQTFMPYPDFEKSVQCLDRRRLWKQCLECWGIWEVIRDPHSISRWRNHPAVRMWRGYGWALDRYWGFAFFEWRNRGGMGGVSVWEALCQCSNEYPDELKDGSPAPWFEQYPPWFGNEAFHASHRSNLLRKDPVWYGKFGWAEPPTLPYVWPV